MTSLHDVSKTIARGSTVILAAELKRPLLSHLTNEILINIQHVVRTATTAIWVTNYGHLYGGNPNKSLAQGLAKTLMNEQPSLRLSCFDIDHEDKDLSHSANLILDQLYRLKNATDSEVDPDLLEMNGIVYIPRFVSDEVENTAFERILNPPIESGALPAGMEIDFRQVGQIDTFYYKSKENPSTMRDKDVLLKFIAYSISGLVSFITYQRTQTCLAYNFVGSINPQRPPRFRRFQL